MKKNLISAFLLFIVIGISFFANNLYAWDAPNSSNSIIDARHNRDFLYKAKEIINTECKDILSAVVDTGTGVPISRRICNNMQGKNGGFITEKFLKAGNDYAWSESGFIIAESMLWSSNWQVLSAFYKAFAQGPQGQLVILGNGMDSTHANEAQSSSAPILAGYLSSTTKQIDLQADPQFCNTKTMITTDTPAFQIWSVNSNKNAAINVRGVQLSGGNPRPGMILVSTDDQGNAVWATPELSTDGTTVSFNYGTDVSPVSTGQTICN